MSAPKKGKDLSALKARLAKKAAKPSPEAAIPAPGEVAAPGEAAVPVPGEAAVPAPGEASVPATAAVSAPGTAPEIPAPGEVSIPAPGEVSVPAPGEALAPEPAAAPAPARQADIGGDPFSGGSSFDPNAGLIDDVGEIKSGAGLGLPIFAALVGIVIGGGLGWMGHKASDSGKRHSSAIAKAGAIEEKINEIEKNRALTALKFGDAEEAIKTKDADKAVAALDELEPTFIELSDIFGWQMASMDPKVVKNIFDLAEANNSMQLDIGILKQLLGQNKEILVGRIKGPTAFVVVLNPQGGSLLTEYVNAICEEMPDPVPEGFSVSSLKKCEGEEILNAKAYTVRMELGGEATMIPATQSFYLTPAGAMYNYAIGQNPSANAKGYFDHHMGVLKASLDGMVKTKDKALEGIANYTKNPNVDGDG